MMLAFIVVLIKPRIKIGLQGVDRFVDLFGRRLDRGELARSDRFSIFLSGMSEAVMLPI